jgi:hypothetical protein
LQELLLNEVGGDPDWACPPLRSRKDERVAPETKLAKLVAREGKFTAIPAATEERESAWTLQPRQETETALLAVIKALVKRLHGVSIPLEDSAASRMGVGSAPNALDRVFLRLLSARTECAIIARCRNITISLFERGPRFVLLGGQPQTGMKRGDARVEKCGAIFRREQLAPPKVPARARLLGIGGHSGDKHQGGGAGRDCLEHDDLPGE